jgi:hypothetical protein
MDELYRIIQPASDRRDVEIGRKTEENRGILRIKDP